MASGGARPGAGRKRSPRNSVPVSWKISADARDWIKEAAEQACITPGEVVDELVKIYREKEA